MMMPRLPGFGGAASCHSSRGQRIFMSDMQTARKAGGSRPLFTGAVVAAIVIVAGLLIWRLFLT
jgi:hypothetical protein